jgi:DNA-binding NarL/FixJ family response regulator
VKPSVLVLDCHDAGREELAGLLAESGYEVSTARVPEEMLSLVEAVQPTAVIADDASLDNRWETLDALRKKLPSGIILLLVTYADAAQLAAAARAGADGFVLKSASPADLVSTLEARFLESQKKGGVGV